VFLSVWQDEIISRDGSRFVRIAAHSKYGRDSRDTNWKERLRHIQYLTDTKRPCYLIICIAKDIHANPRERKDFISDRAFQAGRILNDGDVWIELGAPLPIRKLLPRRPGREESPAS